MVMPRKPAAGKRSKQLNIYLQPALHEAFQSEADRQGVSMSTLAADLIADYVSGASNDDRRIVVHPDVMYAVLRQLMQEGFYIGDKFAPNKADPQKQELAGESTYPHQSVHNSVDTPEDNGSADFTPRLPNTTFQAAETMQQRGDATIAPKTQKRRVDNRKQSKGVDES